MDEVVALKRLLREQRPVDWEGLPDIDLYMDQVVSYLPRQTVGSGGTLTSAMINNYVKDGLLPRASGKRYHREHLAYLTAIGMLKSVLPVKDMKFLLAGNVSPGRERAFYEKFLELTDDAFCQVDDAIDGDLAENQLKDLALRLALLSCAAKIACEELLVAAGEAPDLAETAKRDKEARRAEKAEKKAEKKERGKGSRDP